MVGDLPVSTVSNGFVLRRVPGETLRKGKWTAEEESYASKIIQLFNRGILSIQSGTTLRSYLSEKLNCDPMRITKKFAGASCIGKQVFQPCDDADSSEINQSEEELHALEELFLSKILGKEAKTVGMGGANLPGRSSGRSRTHNSNSNSNSNSNTNPEEYFFDKDDGVDDMDEQAGSRDAKPILACTSEWHLTGSTIANTKSPSMRKGIKRVMSAPALSLLNSRPFLPSTVPHGEGRISMDVFSGSTRSGGGAYAVKPQPSRRSIKRTLSTMDLQEYESYRQNDQAAGDLLLKFVGKVKEGIDSYGSGFLSELDSMGSSIPQPSPNQLYKLPSKKLRSYSPFKEEHVPFVHTRGDSFAKDEGYETTINVMQRHYDASSDASRSSTKSPLGLEMDTDDSNDQKDPLPGTSAIVIPLDAGVRV